MDRPREDLCQPGPQVSPSVASAESDCGQAIAERCISESDEAIAQMREPFVKLVGFVVGLTDNSDSNTNINNYSDTDQ